MITTMFALAMAFLLSLSPSEHIVRTDMRVGGVPVTTLRANLAMVQVKPIVAMGFPGADESFTSMIERARPIAAVNGAYFSTQTLLPIGDIVIGGQLVHSGRMGTALAFDQAGKPDIIRVQRHKTLRWEGYTDVLACGPALIIDGKIDVQHSEEGFRDPSVTGRSQRMAIGYTQNGKLVITWIKQSVTFDEAAKVMKDLGCHEAMNLDAGASLAMAYNAKVIKAPGRKLTNILGLWIR